MMKPKIVSLILRLEERARAVCTLLGVIEYQVRVGGRSVMVREAGDLAGTPVLYFHGTPGSRLDVAFGEDVARALGVRVISFDRPGYGRSEGAPFSLRRIADDAVVIADGCELGHIATLGWSGGGPFALAAAALMGDRVTGAGVACGPGPFGRVPGALGSLGDNDELALSFLPAQPERSARQFCVGSEIMIAVRDDEDALMGGVDALFGDGDADVLADPAMRHRLFVTMSEGLRQGFGGVGWDNVAWVGDWDIDLDAVQCPVHLWYGELDQMMPLAHGEWLERRLRGGDLTVYRDQGHLLPMRHWGAMLRALVSTTGTG